MHVSHLWNKEKHAFTGDSASQGPPWVFSQCMSHLVVKTRVCASICMSEACLPACLQSSCRICCSLRFLARAVFIFRASGWNRSAGWWTVPSTPAASSALATLKHASCSVHAHVRSHVCTVEASFVKHTGCDGEAGGRDSQSSAVMTEQQLHHDRAPVPMTTQPIRWRKERGGEGMMEGCRQGQDEQENRGWQRCSTHRAAAVPLLCRGASDMAAPPSSPPPGLLAIAALSSSCSRSYLLLLLLPSGSFLVRVSRQNMSE